MGTVHGDAERNLHTWFAVGLVLMVIGGIIIGASWPSTETDFGGIYDDPEEVQTGSSGGVVFGFLVAGIGQLGFFYALVGLAVRTGILAARRP